MIRTLHSSVTVPPPPPPLPAPLSCGVAALGVLAGPALLLRLDRSLLALRLERLPPALVASRKAALLRRERQASALAAWAHPLSSVALLLAAGWLATPRLSCVADDAQLAAQLEAASHLALHRGRHHCAWKGDAYDAEGKEACLHKALTNAILRSAVEAALADAGVGPREATALILDAATGRTSGVLAAAGLRRERIFCPNSATPSAHALRQQGVRAFVADIGAFLAARPRLRPGFNLIHLDYCGGIASRARDVEAVFARHVLAPGGVLGLGYSHRDAGAALASREGRDADAHAAVLVEAAAAAHGYVARSVAAHRYDGMGFQAFRVDIA